MTNSRRTQVWIKSSKLISTDGNGHITYPMLQQQVDSATTRLASQILWDGVGSQIRSIWLSMPEAIRR